MQQSENIFQVPMKLYAQESVQNFLTFAILKW